MIPQAFLYISRAFKDNAKHVMGAMKLVAASHPPEDLNRLGMHMYVSITSFMLVTACNLCPDLRPSCADG